jgi:predicted acyl esterase
VPTQQLTDAEARNELRRSQAGIVKESDVRIPVRDGSYLLADVFRPSAPGRYPVLLRLSVYGRAFGMGSIVTEEDRLAAEVREDEWFTQPRDALPGLTRLAENAVSANTFDWVPRGYVCVRVDSRGVGRTPGTLAPFSPQEALDYYDAIEWAAAQDWSDGNVGLYGSSYTGTNQWNVANLRPPSLKAIMPWAADGDAYRELAYPGGILAEAYRRNWWTMVTSASPGSSHSDFYTFEPTDRDLDVIGHPRAALWVSSTSHDMDVFVALRVIKPDGTELRYAHDPREPMASGSLKVSHRRTDPERSSARRPWHTHRREDVQPLQPGEVVEIEVEIMGASARLPAGSRLRLDVHPVERNGDPLGGRPGGFQRAYDRSYHDGARNRVHTGPGFPSRLDLPVMPAAG